MEISPLPVNESKRLEALRSYHILDTEEEQDFNGIVELAIQLCDTPISMITLIAEKRQWYKAIVGSDVKETHRDLSFCAHTIHLDDVMVVNDALEDKRFFDNPFVIGEPNIRFYAGMPIITGDGFKVGTVAVMDLKPREFSNLQLENLRKLGRQVANLLNLRKAVRVLHHTNEEISTLIEKKTTEVKDVVERMSDAIVALDGNWNYTYVSPKAEQIYDKPSGYLIGRNIWEEYPETHSQPFRTSCEKAMDTQQYQFVEEHYSERGIWFENHIYPSLTGVTIYSRDITEGKMAEQEILKVNERANIIAKATNDIVWDWDLLTNEVFWNENYFTYLGYDPKTTPADAESWYRGIHPEDKDRVVAGIHDIIESGENYWSDEYRFFKANKSIVHVMDRGYVMYDKDKKSIRIMGAMRDVTTLKNHEAKIVHEKELSDSIVNGMPGIFYMYDDTGKFIRWNKNFETVSGYSADEIGQMHPLDFFHESEKNLLTERIGKVMTEGFGEVEAHFYTKDKIKIPYYFNGWRIEFEGKICLNGMGIDITDRKRAELALYQNWETYKNLFESNPLPMWIYDTNSLSFVEVNLAAISKYGYSPDEFVTMSIMEIRPDDEKGKFEKAFESGFSTIQNSSGWRHKTKDGSIIDVEIYSHSIFHKGRNCRLVVANDVTEKKKAEEQYRSIFENTLEGIYQSTPDGKLIKANPSLAKIYGFDSPEEMIASVNDVGIDLYAHPPDRLEMKKLLEKNGKAYGVELLGLKKNKETIWVRNNMRVIFDKEGNVDYYEGTLEDITERKKYEEKLKVQFQELQKTNHELDRFVYSVSHDLRAPLASILGLVTVAELEKPPSAFMTYLEMIRDSVNRLEDFIKDILNYSRNSRLKVKIERIDWEKLIGETRKNLNQMSGAERIEMNIDINGQVPFFSDRRRIAILINNLYSNSIKYQDFKKDALLINLRVKTKEEKSTITFSDNGIGIAPGQLEKVFDMFHRASDNAKGSGLGLYIAKETVSKLGGTIKVKSILGLSTSFDIEIPNSPQEEANNEAGD